jgi:BlaI family transcriptional regulator, penicillinase repressor
MIRTDQSVLLGRLDMAGRKTIAITDRQFAVLRVLWANGPLTVRELMEHLPRGDRQPYTTVLGLLQSMEKAGLIAHRKEAQAHRYRPTLSEREATGNLLSDFLGRFFQGSAERLILGLVDSRQLDPRTLRAIEARLAAPPDRPPAPGAPKPPGDGGDRP